MDILFKSGGPKALPSPSNKHFPAEHCIESEGDRVTVEFELELATTVMKWGVLLQGVFTTLTNACSKRTCSKQRLHAVLRRVRAATAFNVKDMAWVACCNKRRSGMAQVASLSRQCFLKQCGCKECHRFRLPMISCGCLRLTVASVQPLLQAAGLLTVVTAPFGRPTSR